MKDKNNGNKNFRLRVAVVGFFFGLAFPLMAAGVVYLEPYSGVPLTVKLLSNHLFLLICLAPIVLSIAPYFVSGTYMKYYTAIEQQRDEQIASMTNAAKFAKKIASGDYDISENNKQEDALSTTLLEMRNTLVYNQQKEDEASWIIAGKSETGDILRKNTKLIPLGEELVAFLAKKMNVVQSAFYIINKENPKDIYIEMVARYAYNRKKHSLNKFKIGQGLVGQAVIENDTIYRTEIPQDYASITSGLMGEQKPRSILIIPLVTQEESFGALEFASIHPISELQIKFVKEISGIIAQTIFSLNVSEHTSKHLEEIDNAQKKQNKLLLNASEIISIYDKDGTIKYIAPSVERILGYTQEELIGKKDINFIHPKGIAAYSEMFNKINAHADGAAQAIFSFIKKDGGRVWMETAGRNMMDDPIINGIVLNTRDITMQRLAEKEERKRGQMQALSENSPDLIIRIDQSGLIYYINPSIQKFSDSTTEDFIAQTIESVDIDPVFAKQLMAIISQTFDSKLQQTSELILNTLNNNYILSIKAIPELNELGKVETVLVVAHDITAMKEIQNAIEASNKKVSESINYAHRIQKSIMPTADIIKQLFPESFLLFKPKDIVSGDFPWIKISGDYTYIAAVDCTGHGVPGALMSFIGYFILNEILGHDEILDSGVVLDRLHKGVQKTLKQDTGESEARDGMDIAMCRINSKTNEIQYSGAHRPLYYIHNNILQEIKGDKYPVGGMHYRTRKDFITTTINYEKGDSIYFFTDGLPDQFNSLGKKFMSKQVMEIINSNQHLAMVELHTYIDSSFENWKGTYKQMDDVLCIGIKLD